METTNKFANALAAESSAESRQETENGAIGFKYTKSKVLDFFFHAGSMRQFTPDRIATEFAEAYAEDPRRALELMFFVRDCRGGMGEKRTFKVCFDWLVRNAPSDAQRLIHLIPEYGSWKTFFDLTDSFRQNPDAEKAAQDFVRRQWMYDSRDLTTTKHVSLMFKWIPSENTSSAATKLLAGYWRKVLGLSPKDYRKELTKFRNAVKIVETDMSAGRWGSINYNTVPAKAGMLYRKAFLRHDEERRRAYLDALKRNDGTAEIKTTSLTIPEMVYHYTVKNCQCEEDPVIEAAWRDIVAKGLSNRIASGILPIIDGSGSMYQNISSSSNVSAIDVSIGLGLYLANINTTPWRGMAIEFGSNPEFFYLPTEASLLEQVKIAIKHNDCGSTDIKKVFELILKTAIRDNLIQSEMPQLCCTFSDMEFDFAYPSAANGDQDTLFSYIKTMYRNAGYKLPKMVFWNINSRTCTIPMTENENGVALLSGYSQSIMDMIMSNKLDPFAILIERLDSPRYEMVRNALK